MGEHNLTHISRELRVRWQHWQCGAFLLFLISVFIRKCILDSDFLKNDTLSTFFSLQYKLAVMLNSINNFPLGNQVSDL